jgi:CheY-like chemotaxis protein
MTTVADEISASCCRVMVVDDQSSVRRTVMETLRTPSVRFKECETKEDFEQRLATDDPPDAVILDLGFPKKHLPDDAFDIAEITEAVRSSWQGVPLVVLTGRNVDAADRNEPDAFVAKPDFDRDPSVLVRAVLQAVGRRAPEGEVWRRVCQEWTDLIPARTEPAQEDRVECGAVSLPLRAAIPWEPEDHGRVLRVDPALLREDDPGWRRVFIRLFLSLEDKAARDELTEVEQGQWQRLCALVDLDAYNQRFRKPPRLVAQLRRDGAGSLLVRFLSAGEARMTENARRDVEFVEADEWFEADVIFGEEDDLVTGFANVEWPISLPEVSDDEVRSLIRRQ